MELSLNGKVALITGGSSGIGLATAAAFLEEGAHVAIVGVSAEENRLAVKTLSVKDSTRLLALCQDLALPANCQEAVEETIAHFGQLDLLINSAGVYLEKSLTAMEEAEYDQLMNVNVKATYFTCQKAIPYLAQSATPAIVNVSSDAGINGNYLCTAYCASKGAITVFTKALALELAPQNIRVNCVCPGDVNTPMLDRELAKVANPRQYLADLTGHYPLGRIAQAKEIADAIVFLASGRASFVTGAAWSIDGGLTSS